MPQHDGQLVVCLNVKTEFTLQGVVTYNIQATKTHANLTLCEPGRDIDYMKRRDIAAMTT